MKIVVAAVTLAMFASCMSMPAAGLAPAPNAPVQAQAQAQAPAAQQVAAPTDVYSGTFQSNSLLGAMNGAKMDAVRKAVIDMIGAEAAEKNKDKLEKALYSTRNPNQFVVSESMVTKRKDNVAAAGQAAMYLYELSIKVNRPAIESTLTANGIAVRTTGGAAAAAPAPAAPAAPAKAPAPAPAAPKANAGDLALTTKDVEGVTPAQQQFIREYVDKLSFMVYLNEASTEEPKILKAGVTQANSWLLQNGFSLVDFDQIEKLKKEGRMIFEAETGGQQSVTQWITQSQSADVYLEIDASLVATQSGKTFVGKGNLTIKIFDTSTGQLLGSTSYSNPGQVSLTDAYDAKFQALATSVWKAIPDAVNQSRTLLAKQLTQGVRYEIIIQKTPDRRTILDFQNKLKANADVKSIKSLPSAKDETKFEVYYFGGSDELESLIYDTSSLVSGLSNMDWVASRGKQLTFTSGM